MKEGDITWSMISISQSAYGYFLGSRFFKAGVKIFLGFQMGKIINFLISPNSMSSTTDECQSNDCRLHLIQFLFILERFYFSSLLAWALLGTWMIKNLKVFSFFEITSYERGRCHKINDPTHRAVPSISLEKWFSKAWVQIFLHQGILQNPKNFRVFSFFKLLWHEKEKIITRSIIQRSWISDTYFPRCGYSKLMPKPSLEISFLRAGLKIFLFRIS